ncbi:MAG: hypothetical protein JSW25_07040 [Thermoplasmata archaeon]|nr:MAG: hypothetical protein JSW25_07040 [Thermoplasmata archaeon]
MESTDRRVVFYGVIAVALSVLLGSVFALGPVGPLPDPMDDFIADWTTQSSSVSQSGNDDSVVSFDLAVHNLTEVTVSLTWQDDEFVNPLGRRDDTLTLQVEGPPGVSVDDRVTGTSGELTLTFDLANVPTDEDAANIGDYLNDDATGEWRITVSVVPAGLRDTGNSWSVSVSYSYYTGRLIDNPEVV